MADLNAHQTTPQDPALNLDSLFSCRYFDLPPQETPACLAVDIWTERFFRANEMVNLYTDVRVFEVLARLGLLPADPLPDTASALAESGVVAERMSSAQWLLAKARLSRVATARSAIADQVVLADVPDGFADDVRRTIAAEDERLTVNLDLIDLAAGGYPAFLRGDGGGSNVVLGPHSLDLWERYFSDANPLYMPTNWLAASVAKEAAGTRTPLRVLEVGAGCGSGSEALLKLLGRDVGACAITDISPNFLRKARQKVSALPGAEQIDLTFQLLDINQPRDAWRLQDGSFDLVFAVNVIHCARELVESLAHLRALLGPGGSLVLGECTRPSPDHPAHPEFIFQLIDEFRSVTLRPPYRTHWGFLDAAGWKTALGEAGFGSIRMVPEFHDDGPIYAHHSMAAMAAMT